MGPRSKAGAWAFALAAGSLGAGTIWPATVGAAPPPVRAELSEAAAPAGELAPLDSVGLPGGTTLYRYEQQVDGVAVDAAQAVIADSPGSPPALVTDATVPGLADPGDASVPRSRAIAIAARSTAAGRPDGPAGASLVISPKGDGVLAWDVRLTTARPVGDFEVLVNAQSGAVLHRYDLLRDLTAQAKLFVSNAVTENDGYQPIAKIGRKEGTGKDKDKDTKRLRSLREPVTLEDLKNGQHCLMGLWVNAKLGDSAHKVCRASLDWGNVTRHDDAFEALEAYHAIDRTQTYIQSLGFTAGTPRGVNDESQKVIADAIAADNSFYSPRHDEISLGTGGVDDGEDQDVIIHEYGHAVQDAQVKGFGRKIQGASMGEGFGDYLAAAMSAETPDVVDHARFDPCVMEWDSTSYAPIPSCLRRTDSNLTEAQGLDRCRIAGFGLDPHCVGRAWSGALWTLRGELGEDGADRSIMDRVTIASHFFVTKDAGFRGGALGLLDADEVLYGSSHCDEIGAEMVARGFVDDPPVCP